MFFHHHTDEVALKNADTRIRALRMTRSTRKRKNDQKTVTSVKIKKRINAAVHVTKIRSETKTVLGRAIVKDGLVEIEMKKNASLRNDAIGKRNVNENERDAKKTEIARDAVVDRQTEGNENWTNFDYKCTA